MSTRSVVAFRDGDSTTGICLDFDGSPDRQIPLLRAVFHDTFFRDLRQMRTVLLKHTAGWALLNPDPAQTAAYIGDKHYLDVPGVGVAYTGDIDATRSDEDVFDGSTFLFDMADSSLHWFTGRDRLLWMPLDDWARIGPWHPGETLPIIAADPIGEALLTGTVPVYTEAHITALAERLGIETGEQLRIVNGGDLFDIHHAAVEVGLLPKATWFITDGDPRDSEGGSITLPHPVPDIDIHIGFLAADFTDDSNDQHQHPDTGQAIRHVLETMANAIATASAGLAAWRAPEPVFVLNLRHPDLDTRSYTHGPAAQVFDLDLGAVFDTRPANAEAALEWAAGQVAQLHEWPLELRHQAHAVIEDAVGAYPAARTMAAALIEEPVDPAAARRARLAAGYPSAQDEAEGRDDFESWLAECTGYGAACRQAATDQGLDPISAALHAAGIDHAVEQTGGFCMVVHVSVPGGFYFGISASEDRDTVPGRHWMIVRYSDTEYDEGEITGSAMPTPDVIALLTGYLNSDAEGTGHEAVVKAVDTATDWLRDELNADAGAVDDLLNLIVNAAGYAAEHPDDGTLAAAIWESYGGGSCIRGCDDEDGCEDPEHSDIVEEVLSSIAELG